MSSVNTLSIAGLDQSGGAGILADIKTFNALKIYGLGVLSSITYQNANSCYGVTYLDEKEIIKQLEAFKDYKINFIKIGLIDWKVLPKIIEWIKQNLKSKIIIDPILSSSSNFEFNKKENVKQVLNQIYQDIYLITPNNDEYYALNLEKYIKKLNILLKGGHNQEKKGVDILFELQIEKEFKPTKQIKQEKRGTGCVLSAAICAYLSKGYNLQNSVKYGKKYLEKYLLSSKINLGFHLN